MSRSSALALVLVASGLGCTRTNPDFAKEAEISTGGTESAGTITTTSSTSPTATSPTSTSDTTTSTTGVADTGAQSGSSGSTGGLGDFGRCPDLLYGLTEDDQTLGMLLVDVSTKQTVTVVTGVSGEALATEPFSGDVYGWPFAADMPGFIVYPGFPFSSDGADFLERPAAVGAGFDPGGTAWLLTRGMDESFLSEFTPGVDAVENRVPLVLTLRGDVVVLGGEAVVFSDDRSVDVVDLDTLLVFSSSQVMGMEAGIEITGAALVGGRIWVSTIIPNNATVSALWELNASNDSTEFTVGQGPFAVDLPLTDLAPVFAHEKDCERFFNLFG